AELQKRASTTRDRRTAKVPPAGMVPEVVSRRVPRTSLLFLGYRLGDLDLRILLHTFKAKLADNEDLNIALQLEPDDPVTEDIEKVVGKSPDSAAPGSRDIVR